MSQSAIQQLESELVAEFDNAPEGLLTNMRLALPKKPAEFNAVTHGLSGQNVFLTTEEIPYFVEMGLGFLREMEPVGIRECSSAQLIFEARWRVHRILSVENDLFCIAPPADGTPPPGKTRSRRPGLDRQVNAFRESARNLEVISRYETRLIRNSARITEELDALQQRRLRKSPELAFDEASSPVMIWYGKILVRYQALAQAKLDYEEGEAAIHAAAANPSVSATSREIPFGTITSAATAKEQRNATAPNQPRPKTRKSAA